MVLGDLAEMGYDAQWFRSSASNCERPISVQAVGITTPCKTDGMIGWSETVVKNREQTGFRLLKIECWLSTKLREKDSAIRHGVLYHPNLSKVGFARGGLWERQTCALVGNGKYQEASRSIRHAC